MNKVFEKFIRLGAFQTKKNRFIQFNDIQSLIISQVKNSKMTKIALYLQKLLSRRDRR